MSFQFMLKAEEKNFFGFEGITALEKHTFKYVL